MNIDLPALANPALSALLNGGYQGVVLTGLVWVAVKLFPRVNASTRHTIWLVALLCVAALPIAHLVFQSKPANPLSLAAPLEDSVEPTGEQALVEISAGNAMAEAPVLEAGLTPAVTGEVPSEPASNPLQWWQLARGACESLWLRPRWESILPSWVSLGLFVMWVLLAAGRLGRLMFGYRALANLKRRTLLAPAALEARFQVLRSALRRPARLRISHKVATPVAAGFFRPAVLLPSALAAQIDPERFDQVIRHELAHIARRDDWSNLFQQITKAVFFFHPGIWWLSRRLDLDREVACDDHVLAVTSRPESYALFLTELASQGQGYRSALAPAAWNTKHQIEERINMILNKKRNTSTITSPLKAGALTLATLVLATTAFQFAPRLALAQESVPGPVELEDKEVLTVEANPAGPEIVATNKESDSRAASRNASASLSQSTDNLKLTVKRPVIIAQAEPSVRSELNIDVKPAKSPERRMEERLARLEKLVEKLLQREEVNEKEIEHRFEVNGKELSFKMTPPKPPKAPEPPRADRKGRTTVIKEKERIEGKARADMEGAHREMEGARQELAARRAQLQAQLEAVRDQLETLDKEMRKLRTIRDVEKTEEHQNRSDSKDEPGQ